MGPGGSLLSLASKIAALPGPVLVLGAGGFVGHRLFRALSAERPDAWGTTSPNGSWRLPRQSRLVALDLASPARLEALLESVSPLLVINCAAYGNSWGQHDVDRTFAVCAALPSRVLEWMARRSPDGTFLQCGSSSEYGADADSPAEDGMARPGSLYGIAKLAATEAVRCYGRNGLRCATLRLYTVYGPLESADRLIPTVIREGRKRRFPPLASPSTTRDFVHVDDVVEAILDAALFLPESHRGSIFNVGTGRATPLSEIAAWAARRFGIEGEPLYGSYPSRPWDGPVWRADSRRARDVLGWQPRISLEEGLDSLAAGEETARSSLPAPPRLSIVVACYQDARSLRELHRRLDQALSRIPVEAEILFVNDGSRDDTESVLVDISRRDARVVGITHSRNFGSQAAFRSGLEASRGDAVVLLDGDLQDPPELLPDLFRLWREGNEVVYGVRESRDEPRLVEWSRKAFYRLFRWASELPIPLDAGDFGLIDRRVVRALLAMPERDCFLRGLRSYVGFRQTGLPYHRPRRPFGESTNSWLSNLEWAKRALASFDSRLSKGIFLTLAAAAAAALVAVPFTDGATGKVLLVVGALHAAALAWVSDKLGRVLQEVKGRPPFLRSRRISAGEIRDWVD